MKTILRTENIKIPEGVTVEIRARVITLKGPRGTLTKDLKHIPIDLRKVDANTIQVDRWFTSGKSNSVIRTACSHIENMITGVTKVRAYCGAGVAQPWDTLVRARLALI